MSTLYKFSSNPLSTIFPESSGERLPNYNNAFNTTLGNPYSLWLIGPLFSTDYVLEWLNNTKNESLRTSLATGLVLLGASDLVNKFKGLSLVNDTISGTNGTSVIPTEGGTKSLGSGASPWGYIGKAADLIGSFMPEKDEYSGEKGGVTLSLDSAYDNISNTLMAIPGWGTLAGGIMKAGALLGKGMNALGGGTDGMTTTDAILGSSFFNLTPLGLINGFGGTTSDTITKNERLFDSMGPSYSGTNLTVNDAVSKSGKKYGLFSSGALREANLEIMEAKRQQGILTNISNEATARYNIRNSMSAINGDRRQYKLLGGYDLSSVRVGRKGMSLEVLNKAKLILLKPKSTFTKIVLTNPELVESPITTITLSTPEFKDGGAISTKITLTNPELVESPKKTRTLEELIEYAKKENPRFILRMSEPLKFVEWEDDKGKHFGTHELSYGEADGRIFVFPMIQEIDGNLVRYLDPTKALFNALDNKNVLLVNNEDEAKLFSESEELPDGTFTGYKSGWVDFFKLSPSKFLSGGSINVIPEGALHARKHNMDIDGITKKGIPVVSEGENGKVELLAEIERSEIILRLSVTKKLEELSKIFYNEESSSKEKEEAALEAGELLTKEILYNTIDNTNELL